MKSGVLFLCLITPMIRIFISIFFSQLCIVVAQTAGHYQTGAIIAFWNVENLYDTINDPQKDDEEFTPTGKLAWTSERYHQKIKNLSGVISDINSEVPRAKLGMIGMCEIENIEVLNDLVTSHSLKG